MEEIKLKKYILQTVGEDISLIDFNDEENLNTIKFNMSFENGIKYCLSRHKWSFATYREKLKNRTKLEDEQYKYSFDLPEDYILMNNAYISKNSSENIKDFQLTDKFYTNEETVYMEYIKNVSTVKFPIYFIEYIKYKIASDICYFLTGDTDLFNILSMQATQHFVIAVNTESMIKKSPTIKTNVFTGARFAR